MSYEVSIVAPNKGDRFTTIQAIVRLGLPDRMSFKPIADKWKADGLVKLIGLCSWERVK